LLPACRSNKSSKNRPQKPHFSRVNLLPKNLIFGRLLLIRLIWQPPARGSNQPDHCRSRHQPISDREMRRLTGDCISNVIAAYWIRRKIWQLRSMIRRILCSNEPNSKHHQTWASFPRGIAHLGYELLNRVRRFLICLGQSEISDRPETMTDHTLQTNIHQSLVIQRCPLRTRGGRAH